MNITEFETEFSITIPESWQPFFIQELQKSYFQELMHKVLQLYQQKVIYPPKTLLWQAFLLTPLDQIQGVLIGQDPYHGPNQACGLAFSLPKDQKITPSLRNILKEVASTTQKDPQIHGDLSHWAKQGIFMLNTFLTVEEKSPLSHQSLGWREFTDTLIHFISTSRPHLVFFLWGKESQKKADLIAPHSHLVLKAPHPSPLSRAKFVGCGCFNQANDFFKIQKKTPILW